MNQNHLPLNVNVANNSAYKSVNKSGHRSRLSEHDISTSEISNIKSTQPTKKSTKLSEKLRLKKNNIQYTPLTLNGILKDHSKPPTTAKHRIKTKSGDMSSLSLSSSG